MDIKLKNIKYKGIVLYVLVALLISTGILSGIEVRNNLFLISKKGIYTSSELANELNQFADLAIQYATYYKSEKYASNPENITEADIEICKAEIRDKKQNEINNIRNNKYQYDDNFSSLSYEQQEKIIEDESKIIEEKYTYTDEQLEEYILKRKVSSFKSLDSKLRNYENLEFYANDITNNMVIGYNKNSDAEYGRFLKEIKVENGTVNSEKIFINGNDRTTDTAFDRMINKYSLYGGYYWYDTSYSLFGNEYKVNTVASTESAYDSTNANSELDIRVWIPKEIQPGDYIYDSLQNMKKCQGRLLVTSIIMISSIIVAVLLILWLKKHPQDNTVIKEVVNWVKKFPIEYKIGTILISLLLLNMSGASMHLGNGYIKRLLLENIIGHTLFFTVSGLVILALFRDYKEGTLLKNNISIKTWKNVSEMMARGSIVKSIFIMGLIYVVCGAILVFLAVTMYWFGPVFILIGIAITIVYLIIIVKQIVYLDKIMVGAKDAASGKLNYTIKEKGHGHLKELAHDINNIKEGLRESVQKEMKSENMKTELITNVSHDLKTPLTSIINYVDLLKKEDIQPETAKDYVNILDKKSQRLKILIEDLFEASKAASGAMELNITKLEVVQLLKQALGENDERFTDNNLIVKFVAPEEKIFVNGDGKRLYRVFENLISNIAKYSLQNTRVYINVVEDENEVCITMRNISSYELNFDAEEITNRFKRGDEARTTDGSGLGLAIAKSIVELHHGEFKIEVDGDLFKSVIRLKTA